MKEDKRHIQLRLSPELRQELEKLSRKYAISVSDVVRGVLLLGMPVFETLTDLRETMVKRIVATLKKEARQ